jgi:hypothetical protein
MSPTATLPKHRDNPPFAIWGRPLRRVALYVLLGFIGAAAAWAGALAYAGSAEAARAYVPILPIMTFFTISVILQKGELSEDPAVPVGERRASAIIFAVLILLWLASTPAMVPA